MRIPGPKLASLTDPFYHRLSSPHRMSSWTGSSVLIQSLRWPRLALSVM